MSSDELKAFAIDILRDTHVMSLGTMDRDGVWVAELVFIHDEDFNLYWISKPSARHSTAIAQNPRAACTITASWETDNERSLQIAGNAVTVDGRPQELEDKLTAKVGPNASDSPDALVGEGYAWYRLTPTSIELTQSIPFGYERQSVPLT
jgi:nitroimidazol reductase NimA-like FMN-containing flavoprotein (pyridoxamine 5'-phosphate oxidase superfamily)